MDEPECPLCLEPLAIDDINFYPCECRYQICRFCWHRIRTDEGGRCPHCRTIYSENPAEYTPPSPEQIAKLKEKSRKKNHEKKQKIVESRKNLSEVRVVQKNLVFVLGLSPRLADPEILKKQEFFGKFGKIYKVVINHHTVYNGTLGPSVSAYVTYQRPEDASKAIQAVNNAFIDGRYLKASFGTTKYCSFFLRGVQCAKPDCMYLHELGEEEASFTKEDMQQGKHQDYEIATLEAANAVQCPVKENPPKRTPSTKSKQQQQQSNNKSTDNSSKQGTESALPLSANWGSKQDKISRSRSKDKQHPPSLKQQQSISHTHKPHPLPLQRAHSHPVHVNPTTIKGTEEFETESSDQGVKNDSPVSLSSSAESLTLSTGSTGTSVKRSNSLSHEASKGMHTLTVHCTSDVSSDVTSEHDVLDKDSFEGTSSGVPSLVDTNSALSPFNHTHQNSSLSDPAVTEIEEQSRSIGMWSEENDDHVNSYNMWSDSAHEIENEMNLLPVDVLKSLGSTSSGEFGSLGVSWQGQPLSSESNEGLEFMSLPWDNSNNEGSTALASILNRKGPPSPPKPEGPVDEKQRLASASYVNYGPTTNSGLEELQVKDSPPLDGKGETLRSTLEDGFKTMFPSIQSPLSHAIQASSLSSSTESTHLYNLFQYPPNQFLSESTARGQSNPTKHSNKTGIGQDTKDWPELSTVTPASSNRGTLPPPPGFGPQKTGEVPSTTSYSLWGGGSLQGLFQQNQSTAPISHPSLVSTNRPTPTSASGHGPVPPRGQRSVPTGAIPHNLLETSLFNTPPTHHSGHTYPLTTPVTGQQPHPTPIQQQQAAIKQQQQQRTLALQQQKYQQAAQMTAFQQQAMLLYQQQMYSQQQHQKQRSSNTQTTQQQSSYYVPSTVSGSGAYLNKMAKDMPVYSYFGGWFPTAYAWGIPTPLTVNTASMSASRLPTSSSQSASGVTGTRVPVYGSQSQHKPPVQNQSLEQKFQTMQMK